MTKRHTERERESERAPLTESHPAISGLTFPAIRPECTGQHRNQTPTFHMAPSIADQCATAAPPQ